MGTVAAQAFNVTDTPSILASDLRSLTEGGMTDDADHFSILFDFNLYFAVRTKQASNGSDKVYTQRGVANWQFDGSGSVAGGVWTKTGGGNTGSGSFAEVKTGPVVPVTTGTPINNLFAGETWSTANQP